MNFGEVLTKAWKIIWKHKILWLFGILAGCGAAQGGGGGGGGNAVYSGEQSGHYGGPSVMSPGLENSFSNFFQRMAEVPVWVWILIAIFVILVMFALSFLALMAGSLGTSGVIKGASMADKADPEDKPLSFGHIFKEVKPYYWKVFLLQLGLRFVGFFIVLFLLIPIILLTVCTCFLGLFLLIPIGWFLELMVYFTIIAILEEDKGIFDGIQRAWQMITRHLGDVFVMFLILGVGQMILGLLFIFPLLALPIPILINLLVTGFKAVGIGLVVSMVLFMLLIPVIVFVVGVVKAYVLTSWTLTYRHLLDEEELEPVVLNKEVISDDEVESN